MTNIPKTHHRLVGRGTAFNPANRFEQIATSPDGEYLDLLQHEADDHTTLRTTLYEDTSRTILSKNDSPDVGFTYSVNPYRGCEHGCVYCYARPTHEYLGFSSGLDFESKIVVKYDAPQLLRAALAKPSWEPQVVVMSGVTDPYQPVERSLKITRACLEIFAETGNPVTIITKSHLVTRDIDLLSALAQKNAVAVCVSITSLDPTIARIMEPRAATPEARLDALRQLTAAGIPCGVMTAPILPTITDHEIPAILRAAREAGAQTAGYVVLRLPYANRELFIEWLERHFPDRKEKVLHRLQELRGGGLYDSTFGIRMKGEGIYAEQIAKLFRFGAKKAGLPMRWPAITTKHFRRPGEQLGLFES